MSLHEDIMTECAADLHFNAELGTSSPVMLHLKSGATVAADAVVSLPTTYGEKTQGRQNVIRGTILIPADKAPAEKTLAAITYKGKLYQVTDFGAVASGFLPCIVERQRKEFTTSSSELGGF